LVGQAAEIVGGDGVLGVVNRWLVVVVRELAAVTASHCWASTTTAWATGILVSLLGGSSLSLVKLVRITYFKMGKRHTSARTSSRVFGPLLPSLETHLLPRRSTTSISINLRRDGSSGVSIIAWMRAK